MGKVARGVVAEGDGGDRVAKGGSRTLREAEEEVEAREQFLREKRNVGGKKVWSQEGG